MRLWEKRLIPFLPKQQLVAQWREILAIKGAIIKNGTPNHRLVNNVLEYPIEHFKAYTGLVVSEMQKRGYKPSLRKFKELLQWEHEAFSTKGPQITYKYWHNDRYLLQCLLNLQEKYDCGIVSPEDWELINNEFARYVGW